MKYVSIDIETTGLNPEICQILSIGAVIEDTLNILPFKDIPKFHAIIPHYQIKGEPFAFNMNKGIIENIGKYHKLSLHEEKAAFSESIGVEFYEEDKIAYALCSFLIKNSYSGGFALNSPITLQVAGKNFATFDKLFLEKLPSWKRYFKIKQRILDPGILFVDWLKDDGLPNLDVCKKRAGLSGLVSHDALEDSMDVVEVLRTKY